ncbi:hypothetical protein L2E82_45495 [Cichorium intybus]|uniref:Uncharacterized protein n=1 Tax=Cichorium intybus TaxID=13427 RepID=A0ACB8ZXJ6_CICIN|nr:hypothetical protein L2E82_45495 [Cichorium intybus]
MSPSRVLRTGFILMAILSQDVRLPKLQNKNLNYVGIGFAEAKVGVNKPLLIPKDFTTVIDVAGFLSDGQVLDFLPVGDGIARVYGLNEIQAGIGQGLLRRVIHMFLQANNNMVEVPPPPPPKYVKIQEKPPLKPPRQKRRQPPLMPLRTPTGPTKLTTALSVDRDLESRDIDEDHTTGMKLQKNHKKWSENIKNSDQDHKMVDVQTYHEMHSIEKQKSEHFGGCMVSDLLGKHPHLMEGCKVIGFFGQPVRRRLLSVVGEEANTATMLGANFSAGFVAGSLAASATCPLDVVKTRRQIEACKDPVRALRMTTRQILMEVWRCVVEGTFDDDGTGTDGDEEYDGDEDEPDIVEKEVRDDNQVVPWSSTLPPPASSSSNNEEFWSADRGVSMQRQHHDVADRSFEDDLNCSSVRIKHRKPSSTVTEPAVVYGGDSDGI